MTSSAASDFDPLLHDAVDDIDIEYPAPSPFRWVLALLAALAFHAGCIAIVYAYLQKDGDDDDLGAIALEVGIELAAPHLEPTDLPPGPEADDSAASPAVVEQKQTLKETDLPKETPVETEDPDRLVSPDAATKPTEEDPKVKEVEAMPSTEAPASEAAAPPTIETAPEAPVSTAPAQGISDSLRRAVMTWQKEMSAYIDKHKRFPEGEFKHAAESTEVVVNFTIDRTGHILSTQVAKSSGVPAYDEAALAMVRRSDPVPMPPARVADEGLSFSKAILFRSKGK